MNFSFAMSTFSDATSNEITRKANESLIKPFGIGDEFDIQDSGIGSQVRELLLVDARTELLSRLRGIKGDPQKVSNLWERFLPRRLSVTERSAAKLLLKNPNFVWCNLMDDRVIEQALIDNVAERFLESLTGAQDYIDNAEGTLRRWHDEQPDAFAVASSVVESYGSYLYKVSGIEVKDQAIEAIKTVRLFSFCLWHAFVTGYVYTKDSTQEVRVASGVLDAIKSLSHLKRVTVGQVRNIEWGTKRQSQQEVAEIRRFLKLSANDNRSAYELIYLSFVDEARYGHPTYKVGNVFQQLHKEICPLLALEPGYLRQKQVNPKTYYGLYHLAKQVRILAKDAIYPMIGTGMGLKYLPEGYVSRFPVEWLSRRGLTPAMLLHAGFSPIQHIGLSTLVKHLQERLVDFRERLDCSDVLTDMKLAHTYEVWIKPIKEALIQRELIRAVGLLDESAGRRIIFEAYAHTIPGKYGKMRADEFSKVNRAELVEDPVTVAAARLRACTSCLEFLGNNFKKDADAQVERVLLSGTELDVFELVAGPEAVCQLGVPHPRTGPVVEFVRKSVLFRDKAKLAYVLSKEHYRGLCISSGGGVLWDELVAMQGLHTTYDEDVVCSAYAHYNPVLKERVKPECKRWLDEAGAIGILCIKYFHKASDGNYAEAVRSLGEPMTRCRTCNVENKYRGAFVRGLRELEPGNKLARTPLYLYAPIVSESARLKAESSILRKALRLANSTNVALAREALTALDYSRITGGLDNTALPVFIMEGEKKILAACQLQEVEIMLRIKRVLDGTISVSELNPYELIIPVGSGGVWLTRKSDDGKHGLCEEVVETIKLEGRKVIIGHDSDGMFNSSTVLAAIKATECLRGYGCDVFYWRPSMGGKGFDDCIYERALQELSHHAWEHKVYAAYEAMAAKFKPNFRRVINTVNLSELEVEKANGHDLQKFLVGSYA